jgi:hypothetical protein
MSLSRRSWLSLRLIRIHRQYGKIRQKTTFTATISDDYNYNHHAFLSDNNLTAIFTTTVHFLVTKYIDLMKFT